MKIKSNHVKIAFTIISFIFLLLSTSCGGGGGGGGASGLAAPTGVTATPGNGQVIIAWTQVASATSYNIYWSTTPNVTLNNSTKITDVANPYTQTGLTYGTTYYYVVTAVYSDGESGASTQVSGTPEETSHAVVLDKTFGTDGIVETGVGIRDDRARAISLQPDGKIVMAGYTEVNGFHKVIALVRYNVDGSLDTTFNSNGIVTTPVGNIDDHAYAIAIQNDGKIVVAGDTETGGVGVYTQFVIVRYNTDGSLDTTFNSDGIVKTSIGGIDDEANGIAIQEDGKIVVAGYTDNGSDKDIALVRYNTDGSLDTTFNSTGIVPGVVTAQVGSLDDRALALALQDDGKIVVAGDTKTGGSSGHHTELALLRFNTDGNLDTTFNSNGIVTTSLGGLIAFVSSIAIQADGKILVSGTGSNVSICLARFNTDGAQDITFDSDGIVTTQTGGLDGEAGGIALQEDGKIVVVGFFAISKDEGYFLFVRYNPDGTLDTTFDTDGEVVGPDHYFAKCIALQPDGKILVAGYTTGVGSFFLMRYE
jgi:uncharacterized delta-60 repeat protein